MKKLIAILVLLSLVISLAACNNAVEESGSSEAEGTTSETEFQWSEKVEKIQQYLSADVDRSFLAKNVFRGRSYEFSRITNDTYVDTDAKKLTDGQSVDVFDTHTFVGWDGGKSVAITFDISDENYEIGEIEIGCLRVVEYGVGLPRYVAVMASNDGKEFTELSRLNTPADISDSAKQTYNFSFPKAIKAKYIRIIFSNQDKSFLFVDEIAAYQFCAEGTINTSVSVDNDQYYTINDFYNYNLNKGESSVKVSESDADYNEIQNLAKLSGVDFQIEHFDPFADGHSNTPKEKIGILTDGKLHGELNSDYFIFQRGGGRHVVADLGHVMSVSKTVVTFFDRYNWGVSTPIVYYISLSEDGDNWTTVYSEYYEKYGNFERTNDTRSIEFASEYRARYVRITFPTVPDNSISSSVYMGEWEIYGRKNPENAVKAVEDDTPYGKYPSTEKHGINNILFAPITDGYGIHCTEKHVMTEEAAYIYLASFDENGKPNGIFYDSLAFSTRGELNNHANRTEGTEFFLSELFYEGLNLDAVESAKGRLNSELGTNDKIKIWVSVNSPAMGDTFNGKTVSTLDDFNACIQWQVDETLRMFNEQNYQNLELVGIYWQHELIRPKTHDKQAMIALNEYLHSKGLLSLWCPYYNAQGIYHNQYVGFDISCLQPNYMFYDTEPTRLRTTAELAKIYGMCVEIEVEGGVQSKEGVQLYREYLSAGYLYGFMKSVKVYYQGGLPGAYIQGYKAEDELTKSIYTDTILYAKELLDKRIDINTNSAIDSLADNNITVKNGENASVSLGKIDNLAYRFSLSAIYGDVRLNLDGTLTYNAMEGYKGEDVIKIEFYDGVSKTKEITINVTVTE